MQIDGPTATVVLGLLGTVCVAIIKIVPHRTSGDLHTDVAVLKSQHDALTRQMGELSGELRGLKNELQRTREAVIEWLNATRPTLPLQRPNQ